MRKMLLYGVIGWDIEARQIVDALDEPGSVTLHIHSPGGLVDEAIAIVSTIQRREEPVYAVVDGLAASAATLIAAACERVTVAPAAQIMTHRPWTVTRGDVDEHTEAIAGLERAEVIMREVYAARVEDPSALMDGEQWFTAEQAVEIGLADAIEHAAAREVPVGSAAAMIEEYREVARELGMPSYQGPRKAENTNHGDGMHTRRQAAQAVTPPADNREDAVIAERQRCAAIVAMCDRHGVPAESRQTYLDTGLSPEQVGSKILDWIADSAVPAPVPSVTVESDAIDRLGADARNSLLARLGKEKLRAGNKLAGRPLIELARAYDPQDGAGGTQAMLARVLDTGSRVYAASDSGITHTTSDFPGLVGGVVLDGLLEAYDQVPTQIDVWTSIESSPRLGEQTIGGLGHFPDLKPVMEGSQYEFVTISGRSSQMTLGTYGHMFGLTRQAIINDELGVFSRIPRKQGFAARRTVARSIIGILVDNPTMSDSEQLFSAAHQNTQAAALDASTLEIAIGQIAAQTDADGETAGLQARYLIVPPALQFTAEALLGATVDGDPNPMSNALQVVVEPFLSSSSSIWYVAAAPQVADTIAQVYLNGDSAPYLAERTGWTVDGIEYKVRLDFGAALLDYRGLARGGTSP